MYSKHVSSLAAPSQKVSRDFRAQKDAIFKSDFGSKADVITRYAAICAAAFLLASYTYPALFLGWLAAYLITNFAYYLALHRANGPVLLPQFCFIVSLNILSSGVFSALPIYLWVTHGMKCFLVVNEFNWVGLSFLPFLVCC